MAMVPAILLTNSLTSHAATLPASALIGIVADWLHVMGAAVWVGGLASLAVLMPQLSGPRDLLRRAVARFMWLALTAVVVVAASGTVQTMLEVGSWSALFGTAYGLGVLAKIGLLGAMVVLGGLNTWRLRKAGSTLSRGVRIELALGVLALAIAAILTGTAPARQAG